MHRLALGSARLYTNTYVCAPCRLRLAASRSRLIDPIQSKQNSHNPYNQFSTSVIRPKGGDPENKAAYADSHDEGTQPDSKPQEIETAGIKETDSSERGSDHAVKGSGQAADSSFSGFKQAHLSVNHTWTQLLADMKAQKSGIPLRRSLKGTPSARRRKLRRTAQKLAQSMGHALVNTYKEGHKYHTKLAGFKSSVEEILKSIDAESPLDDGQETAKKVAPVKAVRKALASSKAAPTNAISKAAFKKHGLTGMSADQKKLVLVVVERLATKYEKAKDEVPEQTIKSEISGVIIEKTMAAATLDIIKARISASAKGSAIKGMTLAEALKAPQKRGSQVANDEVEKIGDVYIKDFAGKVLSSGLLESSNIELAPIDVEQPPVRGLSYGLDRVLFNSGVYQLQDSRSKVYNFDPYLTELVPVQDFNFDLLQGFITSSKDTALIGIAKGNQLKYTGSSSSMTAVLSHYHWLLSRFRPLNTQMISRTFPISDFHQQPTLLTKAPASIFLRWKDGVYAIDSDKEFGSANVLSLLGNSLEKLLTLDKDEYLKYRRDSPEPPSEEKRNAPETYHYTKLGDVLMRSQLDAYDPRLPGTGMFDLKTRAVFPIRMNVAKYEEGRDYELTQPFGQFESYEREYVDMMRATMTKYMLQVRIGRMDGIFLAYHNTQRIFGFQYVPLEEIDLALHGQYDRSLGDQEFRLSVKLMNDAMNKATERFPNTSIRMMFRTMGGKTRTKMLIFAEPMSEDQVNEIQTRNDEKVAAVTEEIMAGKFAQYDKEGRRVVDYSVLERDSAEGTPSRRYNTIAGAEDPDDTLDDLAPSVASATSPENTVTATPADTPTSSKESAPQSLASAPDPDVGQEIDAAGTEEPSNEVAAEVETPKADNNADSDFLDSLTADEEAALAQVEAGAPLLAMELTVKNFVNGEPVDTAGISKAETKLMERQAQVSPFFSAANGDQWDIQYEVKEMTDMRQAWALYLSTSNARSTFLDNDHELNRGLKLIREVGKKWSAKGQKYRATRDKEEADKPKVVFKEQRPAMDASSVAR